MARPHAGASAPAVTELVVQDAFDGLSVRLKKSIERLPTLDGYALGAVRKAPLERSRGTVVFFHGFGQNRYSFHLPGFSLTTWLVHAGYETWNVDLRGHGRSRATSPSPLAADDYLVRDFPGAMRAIAERSGRPAFAVGHSLGGAVLYAGTPHCREAVAGLVAMSAVYGFGGRQPLFRLAGHALRLAPRGGPLDNVVLPIDWVGQGIGRALGAIDHPAAGLSPFTIWHPQTMHRARLAFRVTQGFDRTTVGVLRQLLQWAASRRFTSADGREDYAARWRRDGDVPLLCLGADRDTLLPPSDAKRAYRDSPSRDKLFRIYGRADGGRPWGHVDLIQGDRAPRIVWPEIADWLGARSG